MTIHKKTRLLPKDRVKIFKKYHEQKAKISHLANSYHVSRVTIYKVLREVRLGQISQSKSINKRFRTLEYGIKRLAKIEAKVQEKLKKQAKRYNKSYPGEMLHFDCSRLPLLEGEQKTNRRDYLFVAIDDYSRELFAAIMPDKTSISATKFLNQVLIESSYIVECVYSDNGKEFKGNPNYHPFVQTCIKEQIVQRFTKVKTPRTNGKAERVIKTLKHNWHDKQNFKTREQRQMSLIRFVNFYNTVKPHRSLNNKTPMETLINYFFKSVNNA